MRATTRHSVMRAARWWAAAWVAAVVLALVGAEAAAEEARFALFVGSNRAPAGLETLRYAHEDARKMQRVFTELGGIAEKNAALLLDPTAEELRGALLRLRAHAGARRLLFYYSGHANPEGLLLGNDVMPLGEVRQFLSDERAQVRLALIDACNSGAISRVKGGKLRPGVDIRWAADARVKGAVLVTSSAAEEASIERDDIGGSLFSHFLVSGLRGAADVDDDNKVTLEEAFNYASARTLERSTQSRVGVQHPTYEYQIAGQRQVVLSWLEQPSHIAFGEELAGVYVIFDRTRNQVVAELDKERGKARRLWLPAGDYYIKKRLPSSVLLQKIDLAKGSGYEVKDHKMHTVPYEEDVTKGHSSPVFRPTWGYGAPYIRYTAHVLRRDEASAGVVLAAMGLSDDVTLGTFSLLNLALTPNLFAKIRLARSDTLIWSMRMLILQSYIDRVQGEQRSNITLDANTALSWVVAPELTLSLLGTWQTDSRPDTEDGDEWESQVLRTGASATWALAEHHLLQLLVEGTYTALTERGGSYDWGGRVFYAYAWDVFRLGGGIARDPVVTEDLGITTTFYPSVDLWWRW